jgi:hypothetical protein
MLVEPAGGLLAVLPFVNPSSGRRLLKVVGQMLEAPDKHRHTQIVMLHLHTRTGRVLLEMEASVLGTHPKAFVVMTGCEVNSALAGLIACESLISESEIAPEASTDILPHEEGFELPDSLPIALNDMKRLVERGLVAGPMEPSPRRNSAADGDDEKSESAAATVISSITTAPTTSERERKREREGESDGRSALAEGNCDCDSIDGISVETPVSSITMSTLVGDSVVDHIRDPIVIVAAAGAGFTGE